MRRDVRGAARALVLPTIALVGITLVAPGRLELAGRIYALVLCAAVIVVLLLALRRAYPDETVLREPARSAQRRVPPPSLERIEHETALAIAGTFDLHYHLVPRLRAVAAGLLELAAERVAHGDAGGGAGDSRRGRMGARPPGPARTRGPAREGNPSARARPRRRRAREHVMELAQVQELSSDVLDEVEKAVVGKREALELVWLGFLADGHVLLEDYPGLAKTLAARSFAQVLSMRFTRIQFTPDLMPSDVTGSSIWNQRDGDFEFRPGPIFTNLLLSDEINRAPPKTQAALLEAMQERQVTIEGVTHVLEPPFLVIATQNPIEYEGTYPLPEAQLDRFLLRTAFGYPSREGEVDVLARRIERESDDVELRRVVDRETLLSMQRAIERVYVATSVQEYCVDLVAATRLSPSTAVGASPRGSLALLKLARCRAALQSRDYALPDDVKAIAVPALSHRLVLRPELWVQRVSSEDVVREVLETVPTPRAEDVTAASRA